MLPAQDLPSGGPAYPQATPGVRLTFAPNERLTFRAALFNGDPAGPGSGNPVERDSYGLAFRMRDPPLPIRVAAILSPSKIKSIVVATWELLRNPSAEDLLRQMMIETTGPALDRALLSSAAAIPERPAGPLNGFAPLAWTGDLTNDLIMVLSQIAPVSGNGQIAVVASPNRAVAINLLPRELGYPVLASASLPSGTLIAVALNAVVSATEGAPRTEASTQAVVHGETMPATDIGGGGAVRPVRSMFQSDTIALRLTWGLSWALRDSRAWLGFRDREERIVLARNNSVSEENSTMIRTTRGRLTPLQRAYCLGYRRCLTRMRRELKGMIAHELADMKGVVDEIKRDYENAKQVARAMAERDPEMRLH